MTKVIMAGFANDITIPAIITVSANQSVIVLQLSVISVNPISSGIQRLRLGDSVEKELALIATCKRRMWLTNVNTEQEIVAVVENVG